MVIQGLLCAAVWLVVHGIDRVLSWQTLARPIVTAPLTGLFLGDLTTGIVMGASLEAIFMGISPIGGSIPSDPTASAIISVAYTIISGADIATGLALAMPIGTLMVAVAELYKPVLSSFAPWWEKVCGTGDAKRLHRYLTFFAIFVDRLPQAIVLFVSIAYGVTGLESVISALPAPFMRGLSAASSMMTAVGFAILTSMIWNKEIAVYFFTGFVLAKYLQLPVLAIAILAFTVAITYFFINKAIIDVKNKEAVKVDKLDTKEDFF